MYQPIHEQISVAGVFKYGKFEPRKFLWREREYRVNEVTLRADIKDGGMRHRLYAVVVGKGANANVYRLRYNREDETWWLEEVWLEG